MKREPRGACVGCALGSVLGLVLLVGEFARGGAPTYPDRVADATICDTTSAPAGDSIILDIASARFAGAQDGSYRFEVAGHGNLSDEVRDNQAHAPLITIRIAPGPGRSLVDLRRGAEGSSSVSGVFDETGQPVAGAELAVDQGPAGEAIFSVSGLDLTPGATWAAFTRFALGTELVCDKLDDAFVDNVPALPLDAAEPGPTSTQVPEATAPEGERRERAERPTSDGGFPWWVIGLGGGLAAAALILLWLWGRWPQWPHRWRRPREPGRPPPPPPTPPPGDNEFGA